MSRAGMAVMIPDIQCQQFAWEQHRPATTGKSSPENWLLCIKESHQAAHLHRVRVIHVGRWGHGDVVAIFREVDGLPRPTKGILDPS